MASSERPASPVGATLVDGTTCTVSHGKRGLARAFGILLPGSANS